MLHWGVRILLFTKLNLMTEQTVYQYSHHGLRNQKLKSGTYYLISGQTRGGRDSAVGDRWDVRTRERLAFWLGSGPLPVGHADLTHFSVGDVAVLAIQLALGAHVEEAVLLLAVALQVAVLWTHCWFTRNLFLVWKTRTQVILTSYPEWYFWSNCKCFALLQLSFEIIFQDSIFKLACLQNTCM